MARRRAALSLIAFLGASLVGAAPDATASPTVGEVLFARAAPGGGGVVHRLPATGGTPTIFDHQGAARRPLNTYGAVLSYATDLTINRDLSQLRYTRATELPIRHYLSNDPEGHRSPQLYSAALEVDESFEVYGQNVYGPAYVGTTDQVLYSRLRPSGQGLTSDLYRIHKNYYGPWNTADVYFLGNAEYPSFSPSGAQFVYTRVEEDGSRTGLWIRNDDGGGAFLLTPGIDARDPQWAPDGSRIAYVDAGTSRIYTIAPGGGASTFVAEGTEPAWSNDSSTLYFARTDAGSGSGSRIYSISVPGGVVNQLTPSNGASHNDISPVYYGPSVAPDTVAPGPLAALTVLSDEDPVRLGWTFPSDADVSGVEIRQLEGSIAPTARTQGTLVYRGAGTSARVASVVGTRYSYAAFAFDASGNFATTAATTWTTAVPAPPAPPAEPTPDPPPAVVTPPSVPIAANPFVPAPAPAVAPPAGVPAATAARAPTVRAVVSPLNAPIRVTWAGQRGARFRVDYSTRLWTGSRWVNGPWRRWIASTTATSALFGARNRPEIVQQGRGYVFRVNSLNARGLPQQPGGIARADVALDDSHRGLRYSPGWVAGRAAGHWMTTAHTSTRARASMSVTTLASGLTVVGTRCRTCGSVKVYVDGVFVKTVDLYSAVIRPRQRLFTTSSRARPGRLSLRLETVATRGRTRTVIDAVVVSH